MHLAATVPSPCGAYASCPHHPTPVVLVCMPAPPTTPAVPVCILPPPPRNPSGAGMHFALPSCGTAMVLPLHSYGTASALPQHCLRAVMALACMAVPRQCYGSAAMAMPWHCIGTLQCHGRQLHKFGLLRRTSDLPAGFHAKSKGRGYLDTFLCAPYFLTRNTTIKK